ncbi:hypothetical protein D3C76_592560 [compost metagenome]
MELHRVGAQARAAVVVTFAGQQLPATTHREDVVLPTDRRFDAHRQFAAVVEFLEGLQTLFADVHVFARRDAARALEVHAIAVGATQHADRCRWHGGVDHRVGTVDHQAGRFAAQLVTLEITVTRVGRVAIDAGQLQGLGVDHHGAPHAVEQSHRTVRHDAVEPLAARGQAGLAEGVAHPVLAVDPAVAGMTVGIGEDAFAQLLRGRVFDADVEVIGVARRQREVGVRVHVVQARHAECALQVVHAGVRALEHLDLAEAGDCDQLAVADGHGLGPRVGRVLGVDTTVGQDQVGVGPLHGMGRGKVIGLSHVSHL